MSSGLQGAPCSNEGQPWSYLPPDAVWGSSVDVNHTPNYMLDVEAPNNNLSENHRDTTSSLNSPARRGARLGGLLRPQVEDDEDGATSTSAVVIREEDEFVSSGDSGAVTPHKNNHLRPTKSPEFSDDAYNNYYPHTPGKMKESSASSVSRTTKSASSSSCARSFSKKFGNQPTTASSSERSVKKSASSQQEESPRSDAEEETDGSEENTTNCLQEFLEGPASAPRSSVSQLIESSRRRKKSSDNGLSENMMSGTGNNVDYQSNYQSNYTNSGYYYPSSGGMRGAMMSSESDSSLEDQLENDVQLEDLPSKRRPSDTVVRRNSISAHHARSSGGQRSSMSRGGELGREPTSRASPKDEGSSRGRGPSQGGTTLKSF